MKKMILLQIIFVSLFFTVSVVAANTKPVNFSSTGTEPCSVTINQDLTFTIPNVIYDAGPLVGEMALKVNFQFFGEQNGQLLWQLGDVDTSPSSASCSVSVAPDLSFTLADAVYDAGPSAGQMTLQADFQYSGEKNGTLLWYLAAYKVDNTIAPDLSNVYYVDASATDDSGAGTSPETAKKTIAAGAALMTGNDTLHVANGTYAETSVLNWPNGKNNKISGESKDGVIVDLANRSGLWLIASGSDDDGGTIEKMTIKNLQEPTKPLFVISGTNNFTIQDIFAKDNEQLFDIKNGADNTIIKRFESAGIRSDYQAARFITSGTVNISFSIFRSSENFLHNTSNIWDETGKINISSSLFSGSRGNTLVLKAPNTLSIKNSLFVGVANNISGGYHISGTTANIANLFISNTYSGDNRNLNMGDDITGHTVKPSGIKSQARQGIVLLCVDDIQNWEYAQMYAAIANAKGYKITFNIDVESLPDVGETTEHASLLFNDVKAFLDAGNDFGIHSQTHLSGLDVKPELWDYEVTEAKAKLENYVNQIPGYETWEAVSWASPGNEGSAGLADRIKADGYLFGRMNVDNGTSSYLLQDHAIFTTVAIGSDRIETDEKIDMLSEFSNAVGGVGELILHRDGAPFYDPDAAGLSAMLDRFVANEVLLMNAREYLEWLEDNATYTDGEGNAARWSVTFTKDRFDGRLKEDADAIDAGVFDDLTSPGELDIWGSPVGYIPNIGPDESY